MRLASSRRLIDTTGIGPKRRRRNLRLACEPLEGRALLSTVHVKVDTVPVWTGDWNVSGDSSGANQVEFVAIKHGTYHVSGVLAQVDATGHQTILDKFIPDPNGNDFAAILKGNVQAFSADAGTFVTVGTFELDLLPGSSDAFRGTYTVNGATSTLNATYDVCPNGPPASMITVIGCEGMRDTSTKGGGGGGTPPPGDGRVFGFVSTHERVFVSSGREVVFGSKGKGKGKQSGGILENIALGAETVKQGVATTDDLSFLYDVTHSTAKPGKDFTGPTSGTISFGPLDQVKNIAIQILDKSLKQGKEIVFKLTGATGGVVGPNATTTVDLVDASIGVKLLKQVVIAENKLVNVLGRDLAKARDGEFEKPGGLAKFNGLVGNVSTILNGLSQTARNYEAIYGGDPQFDAAYTSAQVSSGVLLIALDQVKALPETEPNLFPPPA